MTIAATGRIRVPADLDEVTDIGAEDHSDIDPAADRTNLAGGPALVCRGHAPGDPAVPASQRQGRAEPGDRSRLGQCPRRPARRGEGSGHHGHRVLRVLGGQGDRDDRRAHARRAGRLLAGRPGLRVPAHLHQPRQGPHHHPARDDPQRGRPIRHRPAAEPRPHGRHRIRAPQARRAEADTPARPGAHLPRGDVGSAGTRNRFGRNGKEHPRNPRHRDSRPARLPMDELRCRRAGCAAGGAEPRHRQTAARADREGVQDGGRRHHGRDHPVLEHAAVPHRHRAVVQHSSRRRTRCHGSPRSCAAAANSTACG